MYVNLVNVSKDIVHCKFSDSTHRVRFPTTCLSIREDARCNTRIGLELYIKMIDHKKRCK